MRVICAKDYNDVSRKAANIISAQIILKPDCVLGLATGSSPIGAYQQLIKWYEKGDLDFSQVRTVNLDEYVGLSVINPQSYAYFMRHNLFDHVNINTHNTNIPNGMDPNANRECARYDAVIRGRFFESLDDVPRAAYTMGILDIIQAKRVVMVANGEHKAQAVLDSFWGPVTPKVPASILQLHPDFTLVADEAALSLVKDRLW